MPYIHTKRDRLLIDWRQSRVWTQGHKKTRFMHAQHIYVNFRFSHVWSARSSGRRDRQTLKSTNIYFWGLATPWNVSIGMIKYTRTHYSQDLEHPSQHIPREDYTRPWTQGFKAELIEARSVARKSEADFCGWLFGEKAMRRWDRWYHIYVDMKVTIWKPSTLSR